MALNIKLRGTARLVQVADDVAINGDFAIVGNRFYYAYVNRFGEGRVRMSTDTGRTWVTYDSLGQGITNIAARGHLVAWAQGKRGVIYDLLQQWRVVDAYPFDPETYGSLGRMIPLPEIGAVNFQRGGGTGAANVGTMKSIANFGIWDAPSAGVTTGTGSFTTTQRSFLGVYGDQRRQGSGIDKAYDAYLVETWSLGSPAGSWVAVSPREGLSSSTSENDAAPFGEYLNSPFGTRGFEGTLDGVSGVLSSQRRGPPGLGTHNRGIPANLYSIRMDGQQIGLRAVNDIYSGTNYSWAHGGAWVDEYNLIAASGAIAGFRGVIFRDTAGNIVMVKRSGGRFGEWSEAKSYGNPGFAPQTLWLPRAYATVRAGIYGQGEAWFLIDDAPDFIPRGRIVDGDYIANDPPESKVEDRFRKVTFW